MDQDPSSKYKNQEPRVLRPLKDDQGFRIQGPMSLE